MTETEWRDAIDPAPMFLELDQYTSHRKLRLFACACCRHPGAEFLQDEPAMLEVAERYAEGTISFDEFEKAGRDYLYGRPIRAGSSPFGSAVGELISSAVWVCAGRARAVVVDIVRHSGLSTREAEWRRQCALLRCVFGNPYYAPDWDSGCLKWNGGVVAHLATSIYEERAFERLPLLADALEDAGCGDRELIGHLRQPGPHCRGCWPLDLALGKE
jgi:hypothetical protein